MLLRFLEILCIKSVTFVRFKAANVNHVVWSGLEDTRGFSKSAPMIGDMTVPHFDSKAEVTKYLQASNVPATTGIIKSTLRIKSTFVQF